ncbi:hypothetical protein [Hymenobacter sp. B81]|uniref:hypothetical protein n=1 Tax=Hymenobacter sp. B81 TaxID=3344878 RepID=UPI0037DCC158
MKTSLLQASRLLVLAAVASFGLSSAAQAQSAGAKPVSVDQVADFTYLVKVCNPTLQAGQVKLVRMSDNAVLYRSTSYSPTIGKKINFRELPDGQYALVVKVGQDVHRYTLDMHTRMERTSRLGSVTMTAMAVK